MPFKLYVMSKLRIDNLLVVSHHRRGACPIYYHSDARVRWEVVQAHDVGYSWIVLACG